MAKDVKKRYWAFVLYPESAPDDWKEQLQQTGLQFCYSPLHNSDIDPNGELKKEHYHIILAYSGPTTFKNVSSLTASLNQPIPIPLESIKGYYRYFTHKDNPDKFQYDEHDITHVNGFNLVDYCDLSKFEVNEIKKDIVNIIKNNNITEYSKLIDLFISEENMAYFDVACNNTLFFNKYITSRRHSIR